MQLLCLFLNNSNILLNMQMACNALQITQRQILSRVLETLASIGGNEWAVFLIVFHSCICFSHSANTCYGHIARLTLKMNLCSGKWLKSIIIFIMPTMKIMFAPALWSWWLKCLKTIFRHFPSHWGKKSLLLLFFFILQIICFSLAL